MKPPSPGQIAGKLQTVATLAGAGILRAQRPDRLFHAAAALIRWGATPAAGYKAAASRYPDDLALIDESGTLTFKDVHERSNALAHALRAEGVGPGSRVAIMCRNHRGWVEAYVATNKLGAHALFMNTAFSGPQLADVAQREEPAAVVFDEEFADVLAEATRERKRFIAWHEPGADRGEDRTLDDLIAGGDVSDLAPPPEQGKALILTSGTTGTPKGASRKQPQSLDPVAALLERIPLKA
ncbi:MAG TPA: AMP-binding protein, partial [Solirubrobacteraceae bacterium]|nr:AMP-binding protein [Solirubrobacteraceae bacterium]